MSAILLIARNEWRRQFVQPFAWIVLALVGALLAWQFLVAVDVFMKHAGKLASTPGAPGITELIAVPLLQSLSNLMLLLVPLATMQSLAGERRAHTLPLLLAAGIGSVRIVLGKYLGALLLVVLIVVLAVAMPLSLLAGTSLDLGRLAAATLGVVLQASALTAIGIACSAWTAHPALAAAATLVTGSLLAMLDLGARFQGVENALVNWLAMSTHLEPFLRGIVSSIAIAYYVLVAAFALALAARRLDTLRTRA
ncbi:ABC transporter permease [Dokdonella sp. MW10]|uniref:ABC transporter permease n=1 Tax=Dokdonella sp. MW10 TaxID=2992926 RepID=UPI003F80F0AE